MSRKKSLGRVGQFRRAVLAKVPPEELDWMRECLPTEAQQLFLAMHPADQLHALNVAHTALRLNEEQQAGAEAGMLARCALLHDVGRRRGEMDVWGKVWAVLAKKLLPQKIWQELEREQAKYPWQRLGHALYVYRCHPLLGAEMLQGIGLRREADIILCHHAMPRPGDPVELELLRQADELN